MRREPRSIGTYSRDDLYEIAQRGDLGDMVFSWDVPRQYWTSVFITLNFCTDAFLEHLGDGRIHIFARPEHRVATDIARRKFGVDYCQTFETLSETDVHTVRTLIAKHRQLKAFASASPAPIRPGMRL